MFFGDSSQAGQSGHGHSHQGGGECSGHGLHDMPEEMRQKLLKQLEARMMAMQAHGHSHGPDLSKLEQDPLRTSYNPFLYGYGHESVVPSGGWDALIRTSSTSEKSTTSGNKWMAAEEALIPVKDNFWLVNLPPFGRLRIVKDRQGWMMASSIVLYWIYGNWSTWNTILIPYYCDGKMSAFFLLLYAFVSLMCIGSFLRASTLNPGSLRTAQEPQDDWTDCKTCLLKRPPLCHHCRRCGQCIRKMDHHCPWINNCVGEENQFAFLLLLVYACLLSVYTLVLQAFHFFWFGGCVKCDRGSFMIYHQTVINLICTVMAIFMTFSMAGLYITQHISVIHETTTVEWMKIQQQVFLTGIVPEKIPEQTKTCFKTYSVLCGSSHACLWFCPCRRRTQMAGKTSVV